MNKLARLIYGLTASFVFLPLNSFAIGNFLEVQFSGELLSTQCQVSATSINKKITLQNIRWQYINEHGSSAITPFTIEIEKCVQSDLNKIVKFTWESSNLVTIGNDKFLKTQGPSGVLLGLVDGDELPLTWSQAMKIGKVTTVKGEQQFNFGVYVRKPAVGDAKVGEFTGTATFKVEYE
ncbi:fimbrial protein [Providencia sneebia]|uniref:Fimbrial subunit n=1 Tax=Providencia sneebia DSM 19967 TaxID=1141660 RepID=K8WCE3_9GAMM|nr:fimbrial protein [Providencia sneebia]EKT57576.1 fimbrial subunit [Providencia sneebia DSM 19967]